MANASQCGKDCDAECSLSCAVPHYIWLQFHLQQPPSILLEMGKAELELPIHSQEKRTRKSVWLTKLAVACLAVPAIYHFLSSPDSPTTTISNVTSALTSQFGIFGDNSKNPDSLCPIVDKVDPKKYVYESDTIDKVLHDLTFRNESMQKLLESVKYPTQIYDDMINPNSAETLDELYKLEPRWAEMEKFHGFLKDTFPLVHKHLKLEKINKFALVYTWQGTNTEKKPILLTAHYDVVPVQDETVDQWTYPPFTGGFDGKYLYGRGVSDCKDLLIGLMETIELLLAEGTFEPERTILLGFGYDEEAQGTGAVEISKHLISRYGPDSLFQIIDEGDSGVTEYEGNSYILPATGEKGHLDSVIELYTPGGHSSIPPKHTLIGLLSKLISVIEDQEFDSVISNSNPVLNQLQCVAEHSPSVDKQLKNNILKAHLDVTANQKVLDFLISELLGSKYLVTTSQAVDIIQGGVKLNALPEHVSVLINHRIAVEESVHSTSHKVLSQIMGFAEQYDLGVVFEGDVIKKETPNGYFNYSLVGALEPAPVTPMGDEIWNIFGGSLRYLYEDLVFPEKNQTFIFAPYISTGNTDTKAYWDLTRNIFRYAPGLETPHSNIHSIDERLNFQSHTLIIAFYYYYLQVVDQIADPLT